MYKRFDELCTEKGLTPYKVAKDTGISQSALSAWKTGKSTLRPARILLLANYLGVSAAYLSGESDNRTPPMGAPGAPTEEDVKVALFGGDTEVSDEMWEEAKRYAQYLKERNREGK